MSELLKSVSPIDNSIYLERPQATQSEIERALENAARGQRAWQKTPIRKRAEYCRAALQRFKDNQARLAEEITWQMGRPIQYSGAEIDGFIERAAYMIDIAEAGLGRITPPGADGVEKYIARVPLGLVLVIAPWNYPYLTAVNAAVPALMAGNSVILKHADQTLLCAERFVGYFIEAGVPEAVFQYLHLDHAQVAAIIQSGAAQHVAFTGSVAGGAAIERAAAGWFIGTGLELGGKDAAYIRPDAELEQALAATVDGAFFNSGQSCCGLERLYVHAAIHADFLDGYIAKVKAYKLGRPDEPATTLGPMASAAAADRVRRVIAEAEAMGARPHIAPDLFAMDKPGTAYLAPQVVTGVNHDMALMKEETFGPVVGVMPVADDAEALRLINDSRYGLTASIFTRDIDAARPMAAEIEAGVVFINRCDYLDPALAWSGVKDSGHGCSLSELGYAALTRPKSFYFKTV